MNAHTPTAVLTSLLENADGPDTDRADTLAICAELIAACEPQPFTADDWAKRGDTPVEKSAGAAYMATLHWMSLFERQRFDPSPTLSMRLDGARETMRESHALHADAIEIEAIGDIGGGRRIGPGYYGKGLAVYDDGDEPPLMYIPRGLGRENVLLLLRTHDAAFAMGVEAGADQVRDEISAMLVKR